MVHIIRTLREKVGGRPGGAGFADFASLAAVGQFTGSALMRRKALRKRIRPGDARQHGAGAPDPARLVLGLSAPGRHDPGEQAERYGADLPVPDWAARLSCSRCGSRNVDFVVTPGNTGGRL
jgi:hypothetical protein